MMKKIGYGLVLWVVPYVTAIPLLPLMKSDLIFFKTIMVVEGALLGGVLAALYFREVQKDFLREGMIVATVWIILSWLLDFVALLPFSGHSIPRYFIEIGLRYFAILSPVGAIAYVIHARMGEKRAVSS